MAMVSRFEDLPAWQEARKLVNMVYKLTCSGPFAKDFGVRNQIQRASVSAMTNIAEGFDCESKAEFARFLGKGIQPSKYNHCSTPLPTLATLQK